MTAGTRAVTGLVMVVIVVIVFLRVSKINIHYVCIFTFSFCAHTCFAGLERFNMTTLTTMTRPATAGLPAVIVNLFTMTSHDQKH